MNLLFPGDLCAIDNKHKFKQFGESSDIIFYVSNPFLRYSFWKISLLSPHLLFKMLEARDKTAQLYCLQQVTVWRHHPYFEVGITAVVSITA